MATKKIELSGISFEDVEVDGRRVILVSTAKGSNTTLTAAKQNNLTFTIGSGKNRASYTFENHAVFNSGRTAVSLIGSTDEFKATAYKNRNLITINASQVDGMIDLAGNAKNNVIIASDDGSTLYGGKGNDTLIGGDGSDIFIYKKNEGNDLIRGYDETDYDQISISGALKDVTDAAAGKNYSFTFTVGKSKLTVEDASYQEVTFVSGNDTKFFKDGVFYAGDGKSATVPASFGNTGEISFDNSVETIIASSAKNGVWLDGTSKDNSIVGSAKNDTISGENGNDTILGGKGNDVIDGGAGTDYLDGGDGNDSLDGETGNDTLIGGKGNDTLFGDAGNDSLLGGDGNDYLDGGSGADELYGDKGNDKIYGGSGNDTLWGGKGNDSLWGDAGNDTFIYTQGDGNDVIFGFENGDTLKIDIDGFNLANMKASVSKKGDSVKLKIGTGYVTFKDIDATTFHISNADDVITDYQLTEVTNKKGTVTGYKFTEKTA